MSRSFTSRPTVSRTGRGGRGRGRGRGTTSQTQRMDEPKQHEEEGTAGACGEGAAGLQGRIQRRDAYSVIPPNQEKRAAISKQAKEEEERYRQYKEQHKLGHVSYVGTPGGKTVSEAQSRRNLQQKQNSSSFDRKMKSQQYREEQKQRENAEFDKKKADARKRAVQNQQSAEQRQTTLQEDHRRKNDAFLAKIEKENKETMRQKTLAKHNRFSGEPSETFTDSGNQDRDWEMEFEELQEGACARPAPSSHPANTSVGYGVGSSTPLQQLQAQFHDLDPEFLEDILLQVNGDVDLARQLLS